MGTKVVRSAAAGVAARSVSIGRPDPSATHTLLPAAPACPLPAGYLHLGVAKEMPRPCASSASIPIRSSGRPGSIRACSPTKTTAGCAGYAWRARSARISGSWWICWLRARCCCRGPAPADAEPYRRHFRAPVRFDQEIAAIVFPALCLERRIAGADPLLRAMLEERVASLKGTAAMAAPSKKAQRQAPQAASSRCGPSPRKRSRRASMRFRLMRESCPIVAASNPCLTLRRINPIAAGITALRPHCVSFTGSSAGR